MSDYQTNTEVEATFSLEKTENEVVQKIKNSPEVLALKQQLDFNNAESVMQFGNETANEISQFADQILANIKSTNVEDSGELLTQLNKIMDKFDVKDFKDAPKKQSLIGKLFNNAKKGVEQLLKKYETMGGEVEKVYVQLKQYEGEIKTANQNLDQMFRKNMDYFELLEKYILAGKMVAEEVRTKVIPEFESRAIASGEQIDQVHLNNANQSLELLEQRIFDLELAKNVALQSMPQMKMIQQGNYNLMRKINSAFVVTIPIFKQSLTQAIMLKRQAIQAQAMAALDEKTNELLLRNAQNTAMQSKMTAQLASGSSIKVETLEETWRTIVEGIEETKAIQAEARQKRIEGSQKLQEIQDDFRARVQNAGK